jgi:hypothetical protein
MLNSVLFNFFHLSFALYLISRSSLCDFSPRPSLSQAEDQLGRVWIKRKKLVPTALSKAVQRLDAVEAQIAALEAHDDADGDGDGDGADADDIDARQ